MNYRVALTRLNYFYFLVHSHVQIDELKNMYSNVTLSAVGGLLGILLGLGVGLVLTLVFQLPFALNPISVLLAFGVSTAVGVTFGLYPAVRASHLDPIVALRME